MTLLVNSRHPCANVPRGELVRQKQSGRRHKRNCLPAPLTGLELQISAPIEQVTFYLMASVNRDTTLKASIDSTNQKLPIDHDAHKWTGRHQLFGARTCSRYCILS